MHKALNAQARRVAERAVAALDGEQRRQLVALLHRLAASLDAAG